MAINPVIDSDVFNGADKGLPVPIRRTSASSFALRIKNLDHADPPSPYQSGGVPRSAAFNGNVLTISAAPAMPKILVDCDIVGFDLGATKIIWRLQTLYVVGRYKKVSGGSKPHYTARVLSLGDTWTGESSASRFTLFDTNDTNVTFDNPSDRTSGGHAILTVACQPPGSDVFLQDFVHLRIIGTNPTETIVRKYVRDALAQRDKNIEFMTDAVFTHENAFEQFDPAVRTHTKYKGVLFKWPQDPAGFTSVAFDYGIGIGQFTHPGKETVGVCWDWRDNLDAGINELLDDLRATFSAQKTFRLWARDAWSMYNTGSAGSSPYATKLAALDDGKSVQDAKPPPGFNRNAQTAPVAGRPAPTGSPRPWPVGGTVAPQPAASPHLQAAAQAIAESVAGKVSDPAMLAWMWPKLEHEVVNHSGHDKELGFPGLHDSGITERLAHLDRAARRRATDAAFAHLWEHVQAPAAKRRRGVKKAAGKKKVAKKAAAQGAKLQLASVALAAAAPATGVSGEFQSLIPLVRQNIDGGIGGWTNVRLRMFALFGADGNPGVAIPRINAYYGHLVEAGFPPLPSSTHGRDTPVHPVLKAKLDRAAALLQAQGSPDALKFGDIGGFTIRNNANAANLLSNHSFGWAADLDPELNPNVPKKLLPLDVILGLTGVDLYGAVNTALRTPRPFAACLPDVAKFSQASAALVEAFRTMVSLKATSSAAIARATGVALNPAQTDAAFAAAKQGQAAIRKVLTDAGIAAAAAGTASKWLLAAVALFPEKQKATKPEVIGNAATVARFGFCNLPPPLIAALIATDGGKLNWLGAANSTKDFMHFDLFAADQPKLVP